MHVFDVIVTIMLVASLVFGYVQWRKARAVRPRSGAQVPGGGRNAPEGPNDETSVRR